MAEQKPKPTKKNHQLVATRYAQGWPISKALLAGGYSESVAKSGWANVPKAVLKLIPKKARRLIERGKYFSERPEEMRHLIVGRLSENTERGRDAGSSSAKTLGSMRGLDMWTPEQMQGIIVVGQPPQRVLDDINKAGGWEKYLEADD